MRRKLALLFLLAVDLASASDIPLMFHREVLAKAVPDECYFGVGHSNNAFSPTGINVAACLHAGGRPKVNQSYLWGLTKAGDDLWFGTGANVFLFTIGFSFGTSNPITSSVLAGEYGQSAYAKAGLVPAQLGDWRPPDIYVYNLTNGSLTRMDESMPAFARALLDVTLGLRSAGASAPTAAHSNGVVILAGPKLPPPGATQAVSSGVVMYAFDARTRSLITARAFTQFVNIRKWLLHQGVLYTAVSTAAGRGQVLRWISDPGHPQYPLAFEVVGELDTGGSNLAIHEGRLFVSTWPNLEDPGNINVLNLLLQPPGVYMSPVVPPGGLTGAHANGWGKFWDIMDYEVDPACGVGTGIGDLRSFGGYLYWGTMNVPLVTDQFHSLYYGTPANSAAATLQRANTWRAVSIFRARNFQDTVPPSADVELLYGETNLARRGLFSDVWQTNLNASGMAPKYGKSGFGNLFNTYTWTMAVYSNQLFVGTLDVSGVLTRLDENDGADLQCFPSANQPARPVSTRGVGNYANYGVRTILADSNSLYLGTANPMNLLADPNDPRPKGGWELIRLTQRFADRDWDGLSDPWETAYFGNATNAVPTQNPDGDAHNNLSEFITGTDPLNRNDVFSITNATSSPGGNFSLDWFGRAGRIYRVTHSPTLTGGWKSAGTVTGSNAAARFSVPVTSNEFRSFRLDVELAPSGIPGP